MSFKTQPQQTRARQTDDFAGSLDEQLLASSPACWQATHCLEYWARCSHSSDSPAQLVAYIIIFTQWESCSFLPHWSLMWQFLTVSQHNKKQLRRDEKLTTKRENFHIRLSAMRPVEVEGYTFHTCGFIIFFMIERLAGEQHSKNWHFMWKHQSSDVPVMQNCKHKM